ncbi:gliding motility lipoprotein GldB [Winogradskyella sp. J14-2]|uniref:gliding motility lipoprotein GldB n=1 Tax=Winogradskyella sp. J14-2 TaxID=1936080 RepID=UPI000972D76B|nr:gliding motility lipoprotein GldB [Winogradskyella sp. J14-2]APY09679.1 gliding motility lipoprotein GldB [Winogradskyella sp. J14-2]
MSLRIFILLMLGLVLVSCNEDSKLEEQISKVKVDFVVERFDRAYHEAKPSDLAKLKQAFPFLFSKHIPDSIWVERINDTLQDQLLKEVKKAYPDFGDIKKQIKGLFQHLQFYDKTFSVPRVITLTNDVDYRNKTIVTDSLLLVALDNFLGEDHEFYQNIPRYLVKNMQKNQIVPEVAEAYAKKYTFQANRKRFIDEMIYHGKLLYFKDVMIPFKTDAEKIGYTEQELKWAEANESAIWSYFVEKELLFSTDSKLASRFIADAPYSKFYLELDNASPGRLGQYIGWQIVRAYADSTEENVLSILEKEPEEIFNKAKFKPKK